MNFLDQCFPTLDRRDEKYHDSTFADGKPSNNNKVVFKLRETTSEQDTQRCPDLDLDPMTLIYELDLKILKMYLHTKNKLKAFKS